MVHVLSSRILLCPTDPERSRAFYGQRLGLAVYREFGTGPERGTVYFLGGGFLQGWLGTFWESMSHPVFFLLMAGIGLVSGVIVWAMEKPLRPYLQKSHD